MIALAIPLAGSLKSGRVRPAGSATTTPLVLCYRGAAMDGNELLAALIRQVAQRNQPALRELYKRTAGHLLAVASRLLGDRQRAEDVLQETFVAVWERADSFRIDQGQPMTWLIAIVRNRCLNILRSPGLKTVPLITVDADGQERTADAVDPGAGPFERLLENCEDAILRGCLDRLDPEPRNELLMAFYDGLTHMELAERIGRPLGTIKAWVRRSLERMKQCMEAAA